MIGAWLELAALFFEHKIETFNKNMIMTKENEIDNMCECVRVNTAASERKDYYLPWETDRSVH